MNISCVNWGCACSSLIIGGFSFPPYIKRAKHKPEKSWQPNGLRVAVTDEELVEAFFRQFEWALADAERSDSKYYWTDGLTIQGFQQLKGHSFNQFAFLTASTLEGQKIVDVFEKLGFHKTEPTYNTKNHTTVTFWVIEIPRFLEHYRKYLSKKAEKEAGE